MKRRFAMFATLSAAAVALVALEGSAMAGPGIPCLGETPTITGATLIDGTTGDDVIRGSAGIDTINGLGGNDRICGGDGNDVLNGGPGNDLLSGDAQDDQLNGDDGFDAAAFFDAPGPVNANLTIALATGEGSDILSVEGVFGGDFADTLKGNGSSNYLDGGRGNDVLNGGGAPDGLDGGPGNDTIKGGLGFDLVYFDLAPRKVKVNLGTRKATGWGTDQVIGVEDVVGSRFGDTINGSGVGNILSGGAGNDTINGNGGPDRLLGEAGNDKLKGGPGHDRANGGPGNDSCIAELKTSC
jgi:Ca2+-binding RTX toxin-like protein